MENRKLIKYIPILILGFLFSFNSVFAYSVKTHALLSNHVVKFYNQNFPVYADARYDQALNANFHLLPV